MCVIGHTHQQSMKYDRLIKADKDGNQQYHDVLCLTLPSSGGGTYGAGMALPDTAKQSAVWVAISSQPNPYADKISPTGIKYPKIIPAFAFFTPTNTMDTNIKKKRNTEAKIAIAKSLEKKTPIIEKKIDKLVDDIIGVEQYIRNRVGSSIKEKPKTTPEGFKSVEENLEKEEM